MAKSTVPGHWVTQRKRNGEVDTFWVRGHDRRVSDRASYPCHYCEFASTTKRGVRGHVNRVHQADRRSHTRRRGQRFDTKRAVQTHKGFKHGAEGFTRNKNRPEVQRAWNLQKNYGMRLGDFESLLLFQGGRCATCTSTVADSMTRNLHVDHDHATGRVRGLLCSHCNRALGNARDDPTQLRRLAAYLEAGGTS